MVVYHGSNSNFKQLRISKDLVKRNSTLDNEGSGIYFSTDRSVAESYGKYIYVLEVNDGLLWDFTKLSKCREYVELIRNAVFKRFKIKIEYYADLPTVVNRMVFGGQAICAVGYEISQLLDSNENFVLGFSESKKREVYRVCRSFDKSIKAYLFTYHIRGCGVIKDVDPMVVTIKDKIRRL